MTANLCAILSDSSVAPVMECHFTYDCSSVVSISRDGVLRCWNVRTALEPVLGPITMLESIESVDPGTVAWSWSADDLGMDGDMPPIQPDCSLSAQFTNCFR